MNKAEITKRVARLDELLGIVNRHERVKALIEYAQALRVAHREARDEHGNYNEEKLVILIFDGLMRQNKSFIQNFSYLTMGVFATVGLLFLIATLPRLLNALYREGSTQDMSQGKVLQGFDSKGKPLTEEGEPVLYKYMDGVYHDYYDDGKVLYEYHYRQGKLVRKKTFDRQGKIVSDERNP